MVERELAERFGVSRVPVRHLFGDNTDSGTGTGTGTASSTSTSTDPRTGIEGEA